MKNSKWLVYFLISAIGVFIAARCYYLVTDDFRIVNITYDMPYNPKWEVQPSEDQELVDAILSQKLRYIDKGAQCYAFGTEDGNYVVKFIKFKHHKIEKYDKWKILPFSENRIASKIAKHKHKLNAVFDGYSLAYKKRKNSTGLITLHFNRTEGTNKKITVVDKIGLEHEIDLDNTVYIIQRRVKVSDELVDEAISKGDWGAVEWYLFQILALYKEEFNEGLFDRDPSIMTNTGFMDGKPIRIDYGKFINNPSVKDPSTQYREFQEILIRMQKWANKSHPGLKQNFHDLVVNRLEPQTYLLTVGSQQ